MTITEWLEREGVVDRLAELIAVNNGSMVVAGQVGQSSPSDANRWGRVGLTIPEAFELTYLRGIFDGLADGQPPGAMHAARQKISAAIEGRRILIATAEERAVLLENRRNA